MDTRGTLDSWTLDEFVEQTAAALSASGLTGPAPDRRTLRYYATLGVLSRPTPVGREVRYGRRHLLEVLATRRLQANGTRLAEIAERLSGLDENGLAALAADRATPRPTPAAAADRTRFWEVQPHLATEPPAPGPDHLRHRTEVDLADGITLSVPYRHLTPRQVAGLRAAAGPLLATLATLQETR